MREIKFRFWDTNNRRWCGRDITGWVLIDKSNNSQQGIIIAPKTEDIITMQYTGLKDKNGKEIYEGDIVEIKDQPQAGDFNDATYVFEWEKACFVGRMLKGKHLREKTVAWMFDKSGEIIGNIYENPNLLEVKG